MRVIVIGLGSMGKRRIRLIRETDESIEILGIDGREDRRKQCNELFNIETFDEIEKALVNECQCAFVCTSPLSHSELIMICLNANLHVFTELNLVSDGYDEILRLSKEKNKVVFLSSTFLYRKEIEYIKEEVSKSKSTLSYTYHVGQYLPDWHPWEDYTSYFIGDKRTNGCREIMAIEFPWILSVFGEISKVHVLGSKKTKLKTEYNDGYLILIEHNNNTQGMIAIDVISRKPVRNLEIFGEDLYLAWDGTSDGLKKYDLVNKTEEAIYLYDSVSKQEGYADFIIENEYRSEIECFFDMIQNQTIARYGFEEDKHILELIDNIEDRTIEK